MFCISSSLCCGLVYGLWLWHFLVIPTCILVQVITKTRRCVAYSYMAHVHMSSQMESIPSIFSVGFSHHQAQVCNMTSRFVANINQISMSKGKARGYGHIEHFLGNFLILLLIFISHGSSFLTKRCVAYRPWSKAIIKIRFMHTFNKLKNKLSFHDKYVSTKTRHNSNIKNH